MRRGRRGRPQLLCPPCPPIGRCVGQGAGTKLEAKTSRQAERCYSLQEKAARAWRDRCAAPRSSSGCQTRSRRSHGRPAPALRSSSGTAELGHRGTKGSRSQDRCRQAVLGSRSHHSAKPVSSVRLRGTSTMQPHRLCVPRICIDKSYRESKQGRRHCVAHLLGGVQPIRACRVLQRSTPVLVPFLLRGKVRLPVVLHDSRAVEWGSHAVSSSHTSAVSKASRGRGQHHERPQRASPGRSNRNNSGRPSDPGPKPGSRHPNSNGGGPPAATGANLSPSKHVSTPEGPVKSPSSPRADTLAGQQKDTKSSTDSSTNSLQTSAVPVAQSKPTSGSGSRTTLAPSHSHSWPVGSAKSQVQPSSKASRPRANSFTHPPGQQHPQPLTTSWGPSQQSPGPGSGSAQHPSPSTAPSPGGTTTPGQPHSSPNRPGESAPKASKSIKHQKKSLTQLNPSGTIISMQSHNGPNRSGESPLKASKSNRYQKKSLMQPSTGPSGKEQQPPTSASRKDHQPPTSASRKEQQPPTSTSGKDQQPPASTSGKDQQPPASTSGKEQQPTASTSEPELTISYLCESPLEYTTESTTEITCTWPHHYSWLRYLQHLWRLKHLSC